MRIRAAFRAGGGGGLDHGRTTVGAEFRAGGSQGAIFGAARCLLAGLLGRISRISGFFNIFTYTAESITQSKSAGYSLDGGAGLLAARFVTLFQRNK